MYFNFFLRNFFHNIYISLRRKSNNDKNIFSSRYILVNDMPLLNIKVLKISQKRRKRKKEKTGVAKN